MKKFLIFTFLTLLMPNIINTKEKLGAGCCFDDECESNYCSGQYATGGLCWRGGTCKIKP